MTQVFISHSSEDAEFAQLVANGFRGVGLDVWIAPDSIHPGEEFVDAIQRGLAETTHFVIIMSPDAFQSSWVKLEMNTAIRLEREGKLLISPVHYRPSQPPLLLGNYQWLIGDPNAIISQLLTWVGATGGQPDHWSKPRTLSGDELAHIKAGLEEIEAQVAACTLCPLQHERTIAVPGVGPAGAVAMFIGEAPGPEDDQTGVPFVSAAGQFLDELLGLINIDRDDVFLTNVVKCRPNQNRDPETVEVRACADYLDRQIALIDPPLIVTLGSHALKRILPGAKLSAVHGMPKETPDGRRLFAMYHPAAALYRARYRSILIDDFLAMDKHLSS